MLEQSNKIMKSGITINTFGQLNVWQNAHIVEDFLSTKAVLLFVYLAMHPGEQSRKKLASLFWSETNDQQALKNLRTILSSVRQCLPDSVIVARDVLAINPDLSITVDAVHFEKGCKTAFSSPKVLNLLTYMQELADLYQGNFLADVSFREAAELDDWITAKQRHLQQLYSRLLYEIVELAEKQEDFDTALIYARRLLDFDPLWDVALRQLMRLLAYTDRSNEALQLYEEFVLRLDSELEALPEEETSALYEQIQSRNFSLPQKTGKSSITLPDMPFVEPAEDVEIAQRMLNTPNCRLLTIFGISGIGKTSLATQLAYHRQHLYRDGTCFVSLATAQTTSELMHLIAAGLKLNVSHSMDETTLSNLIIDYLKNRELLLVLDNYEQLLPETDFIQLLAQATNSIQIIVTSQLPLSLYREWLLPMRGLRVPEIGTVDPHTYEAIRLFEVTAQRLNPHFRLEDSLDDVIRICQLVDSLTLGIIIAAGWVQYIPPSEILAMMQKDILKVEAVHHDILSRHRSFQGVLDSMLTHLSPQDQQALMCLSIFEASFDYKAALSIAAITMDDFKNLTDKSLVQRTEGYRYAVHSIVRQAFKAQLEKSTLLKTVVSRYTDYFQQWCDDLYAQSLPLHELMHTIDLEQHNLWLVTGLSEMERQKFLMHISLALNEYWINRGYHSRGIIELLQDAGNNPDIAPETRVRGLMTLARMLERSSRYKEAWIVCEQVLELEDDLNLPHIRARVLRVMSEICSLQAKFEEASAYLQQIIAMESQTSILINPQIKHLISLAYEDLGEILMSQGEYELARRYIEIALQRWIERGESLRESIARSYLGIILLKEKNYEAAFQLFKGILSKAQQAKNQTLITIFSSYLGMAAMHLGNYSLTCELFESALQIALQIDRKTTIINLTEQFAQLALYIEAYEIGAQFFGFSLHMREQLKLAIMPHHLPEHLERKQIFEHYLGANYPHYFQMGSRMGLYTVVQLSSSLIDKVNAGSEISEN